MYTALTRTLKILHFHSLFIAMICLAISLHAEASCECEEECENGWPNVSARTYPHCSEFDLFVDLIIWTTREAGADCWAEVITTDRFASSNDLREVHFGWDPGFRVGLSYGMQHDQWDIQAHYTRFHTQGDDHVSSKPGAVHSTFLGNFYVDNPDGLGLSGPAYQKASITWTILFNMFDGGLGRNFWVSKALALRPFLGVKGGWIHQSIHSKWNNAQLLGFQLFHVGTENLKNNFWGVGPEVGINTKWNLFAGPCHCFSLFGDFSGALMWGHWSFGDLFENDVHEQVSIHLPNLNSGASMFRTWMGFVWDVSFGQDRYRFSTKLGYEMQFWLDQLQFYSFTGGRLDNELTLQGGTLEFCFNF